MVPFLIKVQSGRFGGEHAGRAPVSFVAREEEEKGDGDGDGGGRPPPGREIEFHLTLKDLLCETNERFKEVPVAVSTRRVRRNAITPPCWGCLCSLCGAFQ